MATDNTSSDRSRRIRDAVEAALSDVILLGTEELVRLAAAAAHELAAGRPVHTHKLVVSLRDFIRSVLDLDAVPGDVTVPRQGPARPGAARSSGGAPERDGGRKEGGKSGGDAANAGAGAGLGMGIGMGMTDADDHDSR
jgi:hypothetical protein